MSKTLRKIIALSIISSTILGVGVQASALTLDEMYKQSYDYTMVATNKASKHKVKPYYDPKNGGVTETEFVTNAVKNGMQLDIMNARDKINALPDSLLQAKRTFSSILDNYQHPVYERAVATLNNAKATPNQRDLNLIRHLIRDIPTYFKSCYSSAADQVQSEMFIAATNLVDKAISTNNAQDIANANNYINDLKTNEFMSSEIQSFIDSLLNRLVNKIPNNNNNNQASGIVFKDKNLEQAIRQAMNKPTGAISKNDALSVVELKLQGRDIKDISGLENFSNLIVLDLGIQYNSEDMSVKTNNIYDLSPIANLTNLKILSLQENNIMSVYFLRNLVNLERLGLSNNKITNISELSNLNNLKFLFIDSNPILSIEPITNLKNLKYLSITDMNIKQSDIDKIKTILPNCEVEK